MGRSTAGAARGHKDPFRAHHRGEEVRHGVSGLFDSELGQAARRASVQRPVRRRPEGREQGQRSPAEGAEYVADGVRRGRDDLRAAAAGRRQEDVGRRKARNGGRRGGRRLGGGLPPRQSGREEEGGGGAPPRTSEERPNLESLGPRVHLHVGVVLRIRGVAHRASVHELRRVARHRHSRVPLLPTAESDQGSDLRPRRSQQGLRPQYAVP
mmetsp:Transcript_43861/g.133572  ORF Transcript_43861/g.133572 Transcript_43861/m.133572 type:complete len:211 (-) Transcript_43861:500-1132(-)